MDPNIPANGHVGTKCADFDNKIERDDVARSSPLSVKHCHTISKFFQQQPKYVLLQNDLLCEFGGYCQFLLLITNANLYSSRYTFEHHKKWHASKIVLELCQRKLDTKIVPFRQSRNFLLSWLKYLIRHWYSNDYVHQLCDVTCFDLERIPCDVETFDPMSSGPGRIIHQENFTDLKEIKYLKFFFKLISLDAKLYTKQRMLANNIYSIMKCRYDDKITFYYASFEINSLLTQFNAKLNELIVQSSTN
jgi:hypothetical protein